MVSASRLASLMRIQRCCGVPSAITNRRHRYRIARFLRRTTARVTVAAVNAMAAGVRLLPTGMLMSVTTGSMMQSTPEHRVQQQRCDGDEFAKASQDSDPLGCSLGEVWANVIRKVKLLASEMVETGTLRSHNTQT